MTFDGDPLCYWLFIRTFENTIEKATLDSNARLTRLLQYCTGKARKVIQCCSVMDPTEGYNRAMRLLKERFGHDYVIVEAWIEKVTDGPRIKVTDRDALQDFADDLRNCQETLRAMSKLQEINNQKSLVKIVEKLPLYLCNRWKKEAHRIWKRYDRTTFDDVVTFINDAAEEANDPVFGKIADRDPIQRQKPTRKHSNQENIRYNFSTATTHADNSEHNINSQKIDIETRKYDASIKTNDFSTNRPSTIKNCVMCSGSHNLFGCSDFKKLTPDDRFKFVHQKSLCNNCLLPGHFATRCLRNTTCTAAGCGRKHATLLHFQPKNRYDTCNNVIHKPNLHSAQKTNSSSDRNAQSGFTGSTSCDSTGASSTKQFKVSLPIVPVLVKSASGNHVVETYALLDNGSTNSFCSNDLMEQLNLTQSGKTSISITTLAEENKETETSIVSLQISDIDNNNVIDMSRVFARCMLPISLDNMPQPEDIDKWTHLKDIDLPIVSAHKVTLLIGQDVPAALVPLEVRSGAVCDPYATRTLLGWTINGPLQMLNNHHAVVNFIHADHRLENQVENFWKLEGSELLNDDKHSLSTNDRKVINIWNESIRMSEGHYEMAIPLKCRPADLSNNRSIAESRLQSLKRRLMRDQDLHKKYTESIDDLLQKGYAIKIPTEEKSGENGAVWYLPHHPVFHAKKPERIRIVFDCASKYKGSSLNEHVFKGPDLMNSLIGVLIRFREHPVALMADIEGMFHQVKVTPTDRDLLRFLWWPNGDTNQDPEEYRMIVHLFGGVWSPSCANFALQRTATDNETEFDAETVTTIFRNFYVDDCLRSTETEERAITLAGELFQLLSRGGFRLTKWMSNSRRVLRSIPETDRAKDVKDLDQIQDILPTERALGVCWHVEGDQFGFKIAIKYKPYTKRGLLSIISSIYDPLGFASPYILSAKVIFQTLCRLKIGWDDSMPDTVLTQWINWLADLPKMEQFKINRCMKPQVSCDFAQLHHFSDASETGYGTVSYLRTLDGDNNVHCSFVMSKSRLTPLKIVTIPRLELAAAALAVKVDKMIRQNLDITVQESVFWSDSMIVLQYLENDNTRFNTFVANRIQAIHSGSSPQQWHYVSSSLNPADNASRGLTADELINKKSWKCGPDFLWKTPNEWPRRPDILDDTNLIPAEEIKKNVQIYLSTTKDPDDRLECLFLRHSSWYGLKKSVAWLLRFKSYLIEKSCPHRKHGNNPAGRLTVQELKAAEIAILRYLQSISFEEEVRTLSRVVPNDRSPPHLKKSSPLLRLEPILSSEGILCVGGRLTQAPIAEDAKHQMIVPKHHVADLIIRHYHHESGHSGKEHVLALIRQRFWIVKGKSAVAKVLSSCFDCRRYRASPGVQRMSDLPQDRVTPDKPPFTFVGVDYFGPIMVSRGRSMVKRYGCIFTCLVVRAIHIEVSYSLDTNSFINALQRFISRRGLPSEIRSDNGSNLVGANRELRSAIEDWNQEKIDEFLRQKEICWKFNPPLASHMGGAWERQIRTIRKVLRSVLNQQTLDDENLVTFMCQVESIINSRPLTTMSDDIRDAEPLTPNHLLLLRSGSKLPPGLFVKEDLYSRRRWRQVQYLANIFWRRWTKEYLPMLQQRQKWLFPHRNFSKGDLVLIVNENTPRYLWPMARVTDSYPGKDGRVRIVQVRTRSSTLIRPIDKLCLLEAVDPEADLAK